MAYVTTSGSLSGNDAYKGLLCGSPQENSLLKDVRLVGFLAEFWHRQRLLFSIQFLVYVYCCVFAFSVALFAVPVIGLCLVVLAVS